MFYTDRSVIRSTAQSHLSTPFFLNFSLTLCLSSSQTLCLSLIFFCSSRYISVYSIFLFFLFTFPSFMLSTLPVSVSLYHLTVSLSQYHHLQILHTPPLSLRLCVLAFSLWWHLLAVCLHWFSLRTEDVILWPPNPSMCMGACSTFTNKFMELLWSFSSHVST